MDNSKAMDNHAPGFPHVIVGFIGGAFSLLNAPHAALRTLAGAGLVAIFLAICSYSGTQIASSCHKAIKRKWADYKLKKQNKS